MHAAPRKKTGGRVAGTPNKPKAGPSGAPPAPDFLSPARTREAKVDALPDTTSPFPRYKLARIETLIPYANNARTHTKAQIDKIAASIREFGFTNPVLTDGKRGVIAGHGRILAGHQLGMDVLPTIELSHLTAAQRRAYVLADNRLALDAGWDDELLRLELTDLKDEGFDLSLTGFDGLELDRLFGEDEPQPGAAAGDEGALDGKVCCPSCGHEFQTVAKAFRIIADKTTYKSRGA